MFQLYKNKRGQSIVELALTLPLFALMISGIFKIGSALVIEQTLVHAAREGARAGSLTNSNEQIKSAVSIATEFINKNNDKILIEITPPSENERPRGSTLVVKTQYDFDFGILHLIQKKLPITAQASSRIEK